MRYKEKINRIEHFLDNKQLYLPHFSIGGSPESMSYTPFIVIKIKTYKKHNPSFLIFFDIFLLFGWLVLQDNSSVWLVGPTGQ